MKVLRLLGFPAVLLGMGACFGGTDRPASARDSGRSGWLAPLAAWMGKDPERSGTPPAAESAPAPALPRPQKRPIGTVHLVQPAAGFLLIQSSRTLAVAPEAELMTYDAGGRPTGKLKLSPERKSGFLAADIVEGHPQVGDRVLLFSVEGAPGGPALPEGPAVEVLE